MGQLEALDLGEEQLLAEYHKQLRIMAPNDLTAYAEYMHPDEPPAYHHIYFCERLMELEEGLFSRLLISAPPGSAKSTYCSRDFPAWIMGRYPNKRYLLGAHTQTFAENEFGGPIRDVVQQERFRDIFPEVFVNQKRAAAGHWATVNGGQFVVKGVGQKIAGVRAHFASIDDPIGSLEDAESKLIRQKLWDWFQADFTTRLLPGAPLFVIATRWHLDDLIGRLIEQTGKGIGDEFYIINLPALSGDNDVIGRLPGAPLWGEFYTMDHYMKLKETLAPRIWNSLYQGQPTDEEGGVLHADWIQRYDDEPTTEGRPPRPHPEAEETPDERRDRLKQIDPDSVHVKTVISVDSAIKATDRSDYTAICVWKQSASRKHYLVDVIRKRVEFNELVKLVNSTALRYGAHAILIEDKGSGTQYIQTQTGVAPAPVIPINVNNLTKEFRFDAVTPMFQGGLVLLPKAASWLPDYEAELLQFPSGTYDDQVDATSQYLAWARPARRGGTKKMKAQ